MPRGDEIGLGPPAGVCQRYADRLPPFDLSRAPALGEGATPLVRSRRIGPAAGCHHLYFKVEGQNPTGSFKDRGMAVAFARALSAGSKGAICASTGNTSASAAAYGAHCGLPVVVVLPAGQVARGKLAQALFYGARVVAVEGNFDQALATVRALAESRGLTLVNSLNPDRLEGQKTAAFEVVEALGDAPAVLAIPVGNGGNITAYALGFEESLARGEATRRPLLVGGQAEGAAPLVRGEPVHDPRTVVTAIRIGRPVNGSRALAAVAASGGRIEAVTDEAILEMQSALATQEGIFCEPASAAGVAALLKAWQTGALKPEEPVVAVLTGNGLKDPDRAMESAGEPLSAAPTPEAVARALGWEDTR